MTRIDRFLLGTSIMFFVAAMLILILTLITMPPLVGSGCEGSNGDLYAFEEDHFPPCAEIKRT